MNGFIFKAIKIAFALFSTIAISYASHPAHLTAQIKTYQTKMGCMMCHENHADNDTDVQDEA